MADILYTDCIVATMDIGRPGVGDSGYGMFTKAAFAVLGDQIGWVGREIDLPESLSGLARINLGGRLVTPALIDCHTHIIFGGTRAQEFEMRLKGASYADIAQAGGGILSTVNATRSASDDELIKSALTRLDALIAEGVAVIEIKSGYGLTIQDEIRMLRIARALEKQRPVKIMTTWLAAHAIPPEYKDRPDAYIDEVVIPGLSLAHAENLVDAVDGFCETIAFSRPQMDRIFKEAAALGLPVKLHAEQLSDQKGALLAAEYGALSADHLEYLDPGDVEEFADAECVAVLLPGAFYTLKETQLPPITALRNHGVDMAVATDCNPGSSPISSILTAMNMACIQFGLTPEEALAGTTRCAAKALGLPDHGKIAPGYRARLAVWNVSHPAELSYWVGGSPLHEMINPDLVIQDLIDQEINP